MLGCLCGRKKIAVHHVRLKHRFLPHTHVQCMSNCTRCESADGCSECSLGSFSDPAMQKCVEVRSGRSCPR